MLKVMVSVAHLEKGMYVSELDRPWLESPFIFQGFRITNHNEITQLQKVCEYVFVDQEKSAAAIPKHAIFNIASAKPKKVANASPITQIKIESKIADKRPKTKTPSKKAIPQNYLVNFEEELPQAQQSYHESYACIARLIEEARAGSSLNSQAVIEHVNHLADSVIRHPDALLLLSNLRQKSDFVIQHAMNVCILSLVFGRQLGLDETKLKELGIGALLHDIGETLIPTDLLLKTGEYTTAENKIRHSHTSQGASLLQQFGGIPQSAIAIARDHHERTDGSGYPNALRGSEIDFFTRIVTITDVYDMATSGLYNNPAVTSTSALKKMYELRQRFFDAELIEKFIQCIGIYPIGSVVEFTSGEVGIVISAEPGKRLTPKVLLVRDRFERVMSPPKLLKMSLFLERGIKDRYKITRVAKAEKYGINVQNYIINELPQSLVIASAA